MHNKKKVLTIGLAFLFLIVLVITGSKNNQQEEVVSQQGIYVSNKKDAPISIEIVRENSTLSFVKLVDTWYLEQREDIVLDQEAFALVEKSAKVIQADRVIENEQDLQAFGLETPETVIHIIFIKGKETYYVSEMNPTGSRYVMKEGDPNIYVITPQPGDIFSVRLYDLRDKSIPNLMPAEALEIDIQKPGSSLLFKKNGEGAYTMLYAYEDPYEVNIEVFRTQILDNIGRFKIKEFSNNTDAKFTGLSEPAAIISLTYEDETVQIFYFGNMQDEQSVYFSIEGSEEVYTMDAGYLDTILLTEPFHLIVRRFKSGTLERWQQITVDEDAVVAQRDPETQEISYLYNGNPVAAEKVADVFESLAFMEMAGEITEAIALIEPKVQISFTDWEGNTVLYRFIEYQNDYYAVERNEVMNFYIHKEAIENFMALFRAL